MGGLLGTSGGFLSGGVKTTNQTTENKTFTDQRNSQVQADNFANAVNVGDVGEGGSVNLTLSDQGAVQGAFEVADRAFGSIEGVVKDTSALGAYYAKLAADSFKQSGENSLEANRLAADSYRTSGILSADAFQRSTVLAADAFERAGIQGLESQRQVADAYETSTAFIADAYDRANARGEEASRQAADAFEAANVRTGDAYENAAQLGGAINTESVIKWVILAMVALGGGFIFVKAR